MSVLRDELHKRIDELPEEDLAAIAPILRLLDNRGIVIETNLTENEMKIIEQGREDYKNNPETFIPLSKLDA